MEGRGLCQITVTGFVWNDRTPLIIGHVSKIISLGHTHFPWVNLSQSYQPHVSCLFPVSKVLSYTRTI